MFIIAKNFIVYFMTHSQFSCKRFLFKGISFLTCILFLNACQGGDCKDLDGKKCPVLKDLTISDQAHPLDFNHLCSEVDNDFSASWQAYAFFENIPSTENYKALLLAEVAVGWIRGPVGPNGISIGMEKFQIADLVGWAKESFSLALRVSNLRTGEIVTGDFSETFSFSRPGGVGGGIEKYTLSKGGDFYWEKFTEPEEKKKSQNNAYKHTEEIQVLAQNISHPEDHQSLAIVLRNSTTQSELILKGPVLKDLKSRLKIVNPEAQTLGFFQTINPSQKGGLFDFFRVAFRYKDCIYLRKKSKKEFDIRFSRK